MKKQIVVIHGGWSFNKYEYFLDFLRNRKLSLDYFLYKKGWKSGLAVELEKDFEVLVPHMPNKQNAKYEEWKIWFERIAPFLHDGVIFVGHSLGGLFFAKYLSENIYSKKIGSIFLVAAPYNDTEGCGNFQLREDPKKVWSQCQNIHIFQSEDDPLVSMGEAEKYKKAWPEAKMHLFTDRGHFNQEDFPELVEEIKKAEN
jgi:predicted alpha/beta hydrolase family esterase